MGKTNYYSFEVQVQYSYQFLDNEHDKIQNLSYMSVLRHVYKFASRKAYTSLYGVYSASDN